MERLCIYNPPARVDDGEILYYTMNSAPKEVHSAPRMQVRMAYSQRQPDEGCSGALWIEQLKKKKKKKLLQSIVHLGEPVRLRSTLDR